MVLLKNSSVVQKFLQGNSRLKICFFFSFACVVFPFSPACEASISARTGSNYFGLVLVLFVMHAYACVTQTPGSYSSLL